MGQTLTKNFKFRFLNLLSPSLQVSLLRRLAKIPKEGGLVHYNQALDAVRKILVLLPPDRCEVLILQKTLLALKQRYAGSHLDILATAEHRELVQGNAALDGGIFYQPGDFFLFSKPFSELCERVKAEKYDCCFNFCARPDLLASYVMGCTAAPLRLGLQPASLPPFYNLEVIPAKNLTYIGDVANALLRTLGIKIPTRLHWTIGKGLERNVKNLLAESGAAPDQPFCLLHLGPNRAGQEFGQEFLSALFSTPASSWPAPLILLCSRAHQARWQQILKSERGVPFPLVAEDSLVNLSALLERAVSVCTLNNPILHLAVLLEKSLVGLLDREEKNQWLDPAAAHGRWIFYSSLKNLPAAECLPAWQSLT